MDQLNKLYNELMEYDPSLASNKEVVLQVIEKMLKAKPTFSVSAQWQEAFGETLARHIADKKAFIPATRSPFARFTKWSYSFATFLVAIMVVGGSYYWYSNNNIDIKKTKKAKMVVQTQQLANTGDEMQSSYLSGEINNGGQLDQANTIASDSMVAAESSYQNSSFALRNTNTIALTSNADIARINPSAKILTQVDIEAAREKIDLSVSSNVAMGRGTDASSQEYAAGENATSMSMSNDTTIATPPSIDARAIASQTSQKMEVALVFVDQNGSILTTPILEIVESEKIPATFIQANDEAELKLKSMGYELSSSLGSVKAITLSESNFSSLVAIENQTVIRIDVNSLQDARLVKLLIDQLQARGYTFVHLSAISK